MDEAEHVLDLSIRHNDTQNAKHVKAEEKLEFDRQDTLVHFTKDFDQNRQRENTDLTDIDAMRHGYEEYINSVQNITNVAGKTTSHSDCREAEEMGHKKKRCSGDLRNRPLAGTDNISSSSIVRRAGGVTVKLQEESLWRSFGSLGTEMIINRGGRRMFPYVIVAIDGLQPDVLYSVAMEIVDADDRRYKYVNKEWVAMGIADPGPGKQKFMHPDSPSTGAIWGKSYVSFAKARLSNNKDTKNSKESVLLHSMHKYKVVITIKEADIKTIGRTLHFEFPETTFIAVTAYQNSAITQLKIQNNPFAKAFRDVMANTSRRRDVTSKGGEIRLRDTESNILSNTSKMSSSPCPPIYEQNMRIDQQPLMSFQVPPSFGYGCPSPYFPWLHFGPNYPLPSMLPLWYRGLYPIRPLYPGWPNDSDTDIQSDISTHCMAGSLTHSSASSPTCSPASSQTCSQASSPTCSQASSPTCSRASSPTYSQASSLIRSPASSPTCFQASSPTYSQARSLTSSPASSPTCSPAGSPTGSPKLSSTRSSTSEWAETETTTEEKLSEIMVTVE